MLVTNQDVCWLKVSVGYAAGMKASQAIDSFLFYMVYNFIKCFTVVLIDLQQEI